METIDHSISALSDLPALVEVLKHLGASHAQYNIKKEYFKVRILSYDNK